MQIVPSRAQSGEIARRDVQRVTCKHLVCTFLSPLYAFAVGYCALLLASLSRIVSLLVSLLHLCCCWILRPPSGKLVSHCRPLCLYSTPLLFHALAAFWQARSPNCLASCLLSCLPSTHCCWMLCQPSPRLSLFSSSSPGLFVSPTDRHNF